MSISQLDTVSTIKFHPVAGSSAVQFGGIMRQMLRSGSEVRQNATSGNVYATHSAMYAVKPAAEFQTCSIAAVLDAIGLTGARVNADNSHPGLVFYGRKKAEGGGRASGSVNAAFTIKEGLLIPRRLTAEHRDDATLDCETLITYDGTNEPVVPDYESAIPTGGTDNARFTLGPITIGSTAQDVFTLAGVTRFELDFGITAATHGSDSDLYDTIAVIEEIANPTLRISLLDARCLSAAKVPISGKEILADYCAIYLKKRARTSSGFVANNTQEHIKLTPLSGVAYLEEIHNSQGAGNATAQIVIPLISDGTNPPLAIDTTSAI